MSHKVTHIPGEASGTKRHSFVFNFTTILMSYFTEVNVNNTGAKSDQKVKTIITDVWFKNRLMYINTCQQHTMNNVYFNTISIFIVNYCF